MPPVIWYIGQIFQSEKDQRTPIYHSSDVWMPDSSSTPMARQQRSHDPPYEATVWSRHYLVIRRRGSGHVRGARVALAIARSRDTVDLSHMLNKGAAKPQFSCSRDWWQWGVECLCKASSKNYCWCSPISLLRHSQHSYPPDPPPCHCKTKEVYTTMLSWPLMP